MHRATAEELNKYHEAGYFVREQVFEPEELAGFREAVEGIHARIESEADSDGAAPVERIDGKRYQDLLGSTIKWEWREERAEIRSMEPFSHLDPRLDALVGDARLSLPSSSIVGGAGLSLFTDKLNFKRPGGAPFPWHQDGPYFQFGCDHVERLVSLQIYLDDATKENGCLWMIPGSHKHGALPVFEDRGVLDRLYTDVERIDAAEPVPIEAPAGSVIFFHADVVHGSQRNRTRESRRALVITYQPEGHPRWRREDVRPIC